MSKTFYPKVKFELPTIEMEAKMLYNFCHPRPTGWDWSEKVFKVHPKLKILLGGVKDEKKYLQRCHEYAKKYITLHEPKLKNLCQKFQKDWDKIEKSYLQALSEHFETEFPKDIKIIKAFVSICPIYPRFLDRWSFNVGRKTNMKTRATAMHEILHFLYFKKWKEVFPKFSRRTFESPHLVWRLSELLDPIIINNHPQIKNLIKIKQQTYKEFKKAKIGKKKLVPHFETLYKKHLKSRKSFEIFLKTAKKEAWKHRKTINAI